MPNAGSTIRTLVAQHGRKFVVSMAIGSVIALGVRSMFVDLDGATAVADASPVQQHHDAPGHEGHAHDGPMASEDDQHEGHGGKQGHDEPQDQKRTDEPALDTPGKDTEKRDAKEDKPVGVLLALGNEKCPVMGGDVDGKTFTEWSGLRVGHCCPGCRKRFLKNPESLLDEVSPKWRDAAKAAKAIDAAADEEREKLLAAAAKKWTVIRKPSVKPTPTPPAGLLVDVGNENCPVMGGDVDGKTYTEWNGLRIGHCCPGCGKRFLKNPEEMLDEVSTMWREIAAAVEKFNEAEGAAQAKRLDEIRKKWRVVREPATPESDEETPRTSDERRANDTDR